LRLEIDSILEACPILCARRASSRPSLTDQRNKEAGSPTQASLGAARRRAHQPTQYPQID
jgi:hypothetical protein